MGNRILSAQQYYVLDTNTIIDLNFGNLLHRVFQLPCKFLITDLLREELLNPPFDSLAEMGLLVEFLTSEEVGEIPVMMGRYPKPSYYDISVLILARTKNTILITYSEAISAYNVLLKKPRYPPKDECRALLAMWKQRQKLE